MGDKYIIEIEDKPFHKEDGDFLYRAKGFNSLVFDMTGISKLTPYTEPDLERVRKEAYENGYENGFVDGHLKAEKSGQSFYEDGYQRGLSDAWEAARKLYEINWGVLCDLFGKVSVKSEVLDMFTADEVLQKLRAYKQEQEKIKVGDEVENTQTGVKFIVTHLWKNNLGEQGVSGFNQECSAFSTTFGLVVKTGRAFPEIANIFEKMRNEPNAQIDT